MLKDEPQSRSQSTTQKSANNLLNRGTDTIRAKIGMVVDVPETNIFSDFFSVVSGSGNGRVSFDYCRPDFLHFSPDEVQLSADKTIRPVLCPKVALPAFAGYAEVINCGKSETNEDIATAVALRVLQVGCAAEKAVNLSAESQKSSLIDSLGGGRSLTRQIAANSSPRYTDKTFLNESEGVHALDENILPISSSFSSDEGVSTPTADFTYFAIFDGHAGSATAIMASKCLHEHIKFKLSEVMESILLLYDEECVTAVDKNKSKADISVDNLVIGALESAFVDMDDRIGSEKVGGRLPGGCATIVALFLLNKIYVANAGDCRALLISLTGFRQLSTDFCPGAERKRLQAIAYRSHEILNSFSRLEYSRNLSNKDLNSKVLYRDYYMDGWACKTVLQSDLRPPLITKGRKSRLLNTIGVSRGLGDHNLMTMDDKIAIKPFLSACPQVEVFDTRSMDSLTERDVLLLASDGFWDVISNEKVFEMVSNFLSSPDLSIENDEGTKYTLLAQELAAAARGNPTENGRWKLASGGMASVDDITVFVIPLKFAISASAKFLDDNDEEILMA